MQKGNITNLLHYRDTRNAAATKMEPNMNEIETSLETGTCESFNNDLSTAIQNLIHRLKELGPLQ